jgi:hypothetical protein
VRVGIEHADDEVGLSIAVQIRHEQSVPGAGQIERRARLEAAIAIT